MLGTPLCYDFALTLEYVESLRQVKPSVGDFVLQGSGEMVDIYGRDIGCHAVFEEGRIRIEYPWADATCTLCGTCKLLRLFQLRTEGFRMAYVGDGHSDLCPAVEADVVFAKRELAELCAEELRLAQQALAAITGEVSADELLGKIFSGFCIGK